MDKKNEEIAVDEVKAVDESTLESNDIEENEGVALDVSHNDEIEEATKLDKKKLKKEQKQRNKEDKKNKEKARQKESNVLISILDFCRLALICFVVAVIITTFFFRRTTVEGSSMYPTLHEGDEGVTNIIGYLLFGVERFDVVVVRPAQEDAKSESDLWVKRIVGMPGDTISYQNNVLTVNGEVQEEPYVNSDPSTYRDNLDFNSIVLKEDEYFLMGDNRDVSKDSRIVGVFHKEQIVSKGVLIVYPFSNMKVVGSK